MNNNQLTFKSQSLMVDWISFKFQYLSFSKQIDLATYLFEIGFNSYQQSGKLSKPKKEPIKVNPENKFQVLFVIESPHWKGTIVQFSGFNARKFYSLIQNESFSWELLSDSTLGRLDLYYSRRNKKKDSITSDDFLENCYQELKETGKKISLERNQKGSILKIGSRKANHYSRIYQEKKSLKFEYEMKGRFLLNYSYLLFSNNFQELENILTERFLSYFGKILPFKYCYTDWLVVRLRPIRQYKFSGSSLKIHYIKNMDFTTYENRKNFFTWLQFLVYAQKLDYKTDSLGSTSYRRVSFEVKDFLTYINLSPSYYNLKNLVEFFDNLQYNSLIKFFTNNFYRSLVTIPKVTLYKAKNKSWIAEIWIVEELFYYGHPFLFPGLLQLKLPKHQLEVQFKVIQVFSSLGIEKTFLIKEFFENYSATLTNQEKTLIKKYFIQFIQCLQDSDLIEPTYKIFSDGKIIMTDQLNTKNISEGFIVTEKLIF